MAKKRSSTTSASNFSLALQKIKKNRVPDASLTSSSIFLLNDLVNVLADKFSEGSRNAAQYENKSTVKERHSRCAIGLCLNPAFFAEVDKAAKKAIARVVVPHGEEVTA